LNPGETDRARVREGAAPARSLLGFFSLTFGAAWICFISVAAALPAPGMLGYLVVLLGTVTPSLVALTLTFRRHGQAGVRALVGRVLHWRVSARWYLFTAGYTIGIKLTVALLHRVTTGAWPRFENLSWHMIPLAIAISTPVQAGEEIGWRGYALPGLAERFGLARASLLLGLIWALWHLPLFFVRWADTYGQSFPLFALQVVALSVAFAWLWAKTNQSLLLPMLLHAAVNNSKDIVPSAVQGAANTFGFGGSPMAWLTLAALWACAAFFLAWMARTESRRAADGRYRPPRDSGQVRAAIP